jgi:recombination protein RecA
VVSGRIIEIFGTEGSGKTTLLLFMPIEAQKVGLEVAYIDTEHKLNAEYATSWASTPKHRGADLTLGKMF